MDSSGDDARMRVLFVSDHFGHTGGVVHGATRYFLTVLPRLARREVDLRVAFLRGEHPVSAQIKQQGIDPMFFDRGKWSPWTVMDIYRLIRRERIQVIHCAGMKGILTSRLAGRLAGVPVVAHLHDQEPLPTPILKLLRLTKRLCSHTLAVSKDVAEHAQRVMGIAPERCEVLHNGLTLDEMRRVPASAGESFRKQAGMLPEHKVIAIIGRLSPVKGHDTLLRAMPAVLAKEPNARMLIIGDGPQRAELARRVSQLGLDGYVTFTGQINDVYAALRAIDIVAMPSLREGLPYSLLEAMAMDVPVVGSAVGGLAETIRHCENGVLVRPNDAQALAEALISVISDPLLAQTITRGGHQTIRTFDVERHIDRLCTIYRALASGEAVPLADEPSHAGDQDGSPHTHMQPGPATTTEKVS